METEFLAENDRKYIWHPFTQMKDYIPIPITSGKGSILYGYDGKEYIDAISSWWVNLHGHAHPYIVEAVQKQSAVLEHVIFADFTHKPAVELAKTLIPLLPGGMSKIFYSDNGSTAVEVALKIAIQYCQNKKNWKKATIVCFKGSYHGDTFGAMSAAGKNEFNKPFSKYLFQVEVIDPPIDGQEEISLKQLQNIIRRKNVSCFIFEPLILGAGGMVIYSAEKLNQLLECCKENNVLTIADEVMTGFGRTGGLFACEQLKFFPDVYCLSKGLTGGFLPLGATVCTQEIYDAFLGDDLRQAFLHGHSYTANPIACRSAVASLELLEELSCAFQRKKIAESHRNFCEKWRSHKKLKRCECLGTILTLEYHSEKYSYFQPMRKRLRDFFLRGGVFLRPIGNVLYVMPPYCITEEELQKIYDLIVFTLEDE